MPKGTTNHYLVGQRVQIPAYTDLHARGARFGTIARVYLPTKRYLQAKDPRALDLFFVKMDHSQVKKLACVVADDCEFV